MNSQRNGRLLSKQSLNGNALLMNPFRRRRHRTIRRSGGSVLCIHEVLGLRHVAPVNSGIRPTAAWRWDMKAICLRARGGPEAFAYEEAPQPHPGEGEVLVRVHAAGVIHTELSWVPTWTTRAGEPRPLPVIPGHEFSGEI